MSQATLFARPDVTDVADAERQSSFDAYYTPPLLADCLVDLLYLPIWSAWLGRKSRVLEPSAGGGAFVRALRRRGTPVHALDVDPTAPGLHEATTHAVGDFLGWQGEADWVVGNPPYSDAEAHVRHALSISPRVAFLLRLAFLESAERLPLWSAHRPRRVYVLSERPSFTGGGTDSAAYGWFVWDGSPKRTELEWLSWKRWRLSPSVTPATAPEPTE